MANISGAGGCVKNDSTVIVGVREWSMNYTIDTFDSTSFAETAPTHKSIITGLKSATGSFTGNITDGATGIPGALAVGTSYTLNLETDGTDKYSMTAYITSMDHTVTIDGEAMVTANFQSSGDVTKSIS